MQTMAKMTKMPMALITTSVNIAARILAISARIFSPIPTSGS